MADIHEQTSALLQQLQTATTLAAVNSKKHFAQQTSSRTQPAYKSFAKSLEYTDKLPNEVEHEAFMRPDEPVEPLTPATSEQVAALTDDLPAAPDLTAPATAQPPTPATLDPIGFELWEALAYDLALDNANPQIIANGYNITLTQLDELRANPYFDKMLRNKQEEVKQLGSDAAFAVKMRMVANRATPQFLQRLTSSATNNKDFHALFKTAVELAQLVPQADNDDVPPQAVIGASVTFNIQGVPGLDHLSTSVSTTAPPAQDVTDAEFEEVIEHQSNKLSATDNDELGEL